MREIKTAMPDADILIVGGGIIGMSLGLELQARGKSVLVLERMAEGVTPGMASWAAAGMIAAEDPFHPAELRELSRWSAGLYDAYLERLGGEVRYQTHETRQYLADGSSVELAERSVDPRELFAALRRASASVMRTGVVVRSVSESDEGVSVVSESGEVFRANKMVWANGAWASPWMTPRKGQMMRVRLREPMAVVHRAEHVYVVSRTHGAQTGTALVGATVEDAGFDVSVRADDLERLRVWAAELVPEVRVAEIVESWAGLRPASASGLPVMGALPGSERQFVCGGHFRNGVLLAPGSAVVMADLVEGREPVVDVGAFEVGA